MKSIQNCFRIYLFCRYTPSVNLFIGVLDIFGFECFDNNHFEQLCINYANERLQKHFNCYVFEEEAKMYEHEGVDWKNLDFPDNSSSCNLIEERSEGYIIYQFPSGSICFLCVRLRSTRSRTFSYGAVVAAVVLGVTERKDSRGRARCAL